MAAYQLVKRSRYRT